MRAAANTRARRYVFIFAGAAEDECLITTFIEIRVMITRVKIAAARYDDERVTLMLRDVTFE